MKILLVRHGETGGNVAHRHQAEDTKLSNKGKEQVRKVADEIKKFKPTHLVSSSMMRTVETSRIIGEVCGLVPDTNHHFIELVRPDFMYGRYHRSLKSIIFYFQWYFGMSVGGESYKNLRQRFLEAQKSLAAYPNDACLVVVSHSVFINLFVAHLCREKSLRPLKAAQVFKRILTMPNTHITSLTFDSEADNDSCPWSIDK